MSRKLTIKDNSGNFIDVTRDILSIDNIKELNYLVDNYNHIEYAYIRTKSIDEIDSLINVETVIDNEPININKMFYKPYDPSLGNIPYDPLFIDVKRFDSNNDVNDKLFNKFQKSNFIISAIYRDNDKAEAIDDTYWTSQPQGVNDEYKYEWQIQRTRKLIKNNKDYVGVWNYFTYPILINSYSVKCLGDDSNAFWCDESGLHIKINNDIFDIKNDNGNIKYEKLITITNE